MNWLTTILPGIAHPHRDLTPEQVVQVCLDALQNDDLLPAHESIRFAFNFVSPAHREFVGPVETFIAIIKNPLYRDLGGFERAELSDAVRVGDVAQQRVRLIHKQHRAVYTFILSRQIDTPFHDCWMIDAVIRES
jgi:hypothetical protein